MNRMSVLFPVVAVGAGLMPAVIGASARLVAAPASPVSAAAMRLGTASPLMVVRPAGPRLSAGPAPIPVVLAADEKKPPKESDFPELYVKAYPEKPAPGYQVYTLSGGEDPKTPIAADDDLTVRLNDEMIFADNDGWKCPDDRGGKWKGVPITFHAKPEDKITLVLYDLVPDMWGLGPVYIHRADGKRAVLQPHVEGQSTPGLKGGLYEDAPPGPDAPRHKVLEATWTIKDVLP
jgi:hypothetical protein